jgi:hypothetical protein
MHAAEKRTLADRLNVAFSAVCRPPLLAQRGRSVACIGAAALDFRNGWEPPSATFRRNALNNTGTALYGRAVKSQVCGGKLCDLCEHLPVE